uniref:coiled-coil and C2 domain-containing protein 1A-like isoform X2 n=1 Tax=Myxine glutinosa TaxID=7769 RepID=UPI00358EED96
MSRPPHRRGEGAKKMGLLPMGGEDVNDAELEAEFALLIGESTQKQKTEEALLEIEKISRMADTCMKDDFDDGEAAESEDLENDAELAELHGILEEPGGLEIPSSTKRPASPSPCTQESSEKRGSVSIVSVIDERVVMYEKAVVLAQEAGETSKKRRYERGLKTLKTMQKATQQGKPIAEADIPPAVWTGAGVKPSPLDGPPATSPSSRGLLPQPSSPIATPVERSSLAARSPPMPPAPHSSPSETPPPCPPRKVHVAAKQEEVTKGSEDVKVVCTKRMNEYHSAAVAAKCQGDLKAARDYLAISKQFEAVLAALERGDAVDLNNMPPPPPTSSQAPSLSRDRLLVPAPLHASTSTPTPGKAQLPVQSPQVTPPSASPPAPTTALEAMEQRLAVYTAIAERARQEDNNSKARRHDRITKQYKDAIKMTKAGRPVDFLALPSLPSFPPIPGVTQSGQSGFEECLAAASQLVKEEAQPEEEEQEHIAPRPSPAATSPSLPPAQHKTTPSDSMSTASPNSPQVKISKVDQQLDFIQRRKRSVLAVAVRAKRAGDLTTARAALRQARGFDPQIEASNGGLPVDISTVPPPFDESAEFNLASAKLINEGFEVVSRRSTGRTPRDEEMYEHLMEELKNQLLHCQKRGMAFAHKGMLAEALRFEKLADECRGSRQRLKDSYAHGLPTPQFIRKSHSLPIIRTFDELGSDEMELTIIRAQNLIPPEGVSPQDLACYVKFEFPFPNAEQAQTDKTNAESGINPEFGATFCLNISRGSRGLTRVLSSRGIRFTLCHKRWLKSQTIGMAQIRLEGLQKLCQVHVTTQVTEGRRAACGNLEVRVRLKEPLSGTEQTEISENWLDVQAATPVKKDNVKARTTVIGSLASMGLELHMLNKQLEVFTERKTKPPPELTNQAAELRRRMEAQREALRVGGKAAMSEYISYLRALLPKLAENAQIAAHRERREEARLALSKRKVVEAELQKLLGKPTKSH